MQIYHLGSLYHTPPDVMHVTSGLFKFSTVWHTQQDPHKYQRIQNMCAKLVLGKSKYDSSTESLKALHWVPIQQLIEFKILTLTHKCINNSAPRYLQELMSVKEQKRENMRSNSIGVLLNMPTVKWTSFALRSFRHVAPTLWNRLPTNIRCTNSLDKFKELLKTFLFQAAFC